jgi:transposase InsO family protein
LPFDHIAIDLAGPFPTSEAGFNYVLVHVDLLTRFIIVRPLQSKLALEVAQTLFQIWTTFGFPTIVQSDNGGEFVNSILKELTTTLSIHHRLTSPYNPRSEGLGESAVKIFKQVLV